jgi:hypothetical protein
VSEAMGAVSRIALLIVAEVHRPAENKSTVHWGWRCRACGSEAEGKGAIVAHKMDCPLAVVARLAERTWHTIETAPRDRDVLLRIDGEVYIGRYYPDAYRAGWYTSGNQPDTDYPRPDDPTHWQELPPP